MSDTVSVFVVDASGYRSVVAGELGLREDPPRMRTCSRTLFTHMTGVKPYEAVDPGPAPLAPWSQGTLHHFFDGGWVWVIPFGNHRGSRNRLCSVGLSLDARRSPRDPEVGPEEEWARFLAEHPSVARQFEDAVPVRPWVQTDRVQYSSSRCVGPRFWLTAHAAGTVDALYSMGNINTFQSIATGVRLILEAFERDTFTEEHFQPLQRLTDNLLRFQDRIVYGSYAALRSPALLELWFTLWGLTDGARVREVLKPLVRYARTGDVADLTTYDARPEDVLTGFGQTTDLVPAEEALDLLDTFCDLMQELEEGRATVAETEERLHDAMEADPRFDMHVDAITAGLGEHPWLFEPLSRLGVKAYSGAFLTPEEVLTLGVPAPEGAPRPAEAEDPAAESTARNGAAPRTLRERVQDLRRELGEYRTHTGALEQELAAWRDQAAALERDRDAWRERAGADPGADDGPGTASPDLARELAAQREQAAALERDRDAWRARAAEAEARLDRSLTDRVRKTLRGLGRREG